MMIIKRDRNIFSPFDNKEESGAGTRTLTSSVLGITSGSDISILPVSDRILFFQEMRLHQNSVDIIQFPFPGLFNMWRTGRNFSSGGQVSGEGRGEKIWWGWESEKCPFVLKRQQQRPQLISRTHRWTTAPSGPISHTLSHARTHSLSVSISLNPKTQTHSTYP